MRRAILLTLIIASAAWAENESSVVSKLMTADSTVALEQSIAAAKDFGLPHQMCVEAKLNYGLRTEDTSYLKRVLPEVEQIVTDFKRGQSGLGLVSVEQLRGLTSFARALIALEEEEVDTFKSEVQAAVWLFPEQSSSFSKAIAKYQRHQRLYRQTLNLGEQLPKLGGGGVSLGDLLSGQRGLLLIFWSNKLDTEGKAWPALASRLNGLKAEGIRSCLVFPDADSSVKPSGQPQLLDHGGSLAASLEVTRLPTAVFLSPQGKVLHHSHPEERSLWNQLSKKAPGLGKGRTD
jgi:hypothetical protein